jgi:predicted nucleic acid-binding Zn ribbon protein
MPTYVYETTGAKKRRFEMRQSMKDNALTQDPETGEPVRRVISGGYGYMQKGLKKTPAPKPAGHACCGGHCGCGH